MNTEEFRDILYELRRIGADHQFVEAKASESSLPSSMIESVSAFANTLGGIILLGVNEGHGTFEVVGLNNPDKIANNFQAACSNLNPPIRPQIDLVEWEGKVVLVAKILIVAAHLRPCFVGKDPYTGSFYRVGDADQHMTSEEVSELLSGRDSVDNSIRLVKQGAFDQHTLNSFITKVKKEKQSREEALYRWNIVDKTLTYPTLAGVLTLGEDPAAYLPAARIAYRKTDLQNDAIRFAGKHIEGTIGELLEQSVDELASDLTTVQLERNGKVFDDTDVPLIALRELVANALMHRSFSEGQSNTNIAIELTPESIIITNPGCLHVGTPISDLGVSTLSNVRNHTLVRICEQLRTPTGARIVENQASGIQAADRACRERQILPPFFHELPNRFQAYILRGKTDTKYAQSLLKKTPLAKNASAIRTVACLLKLQEAHGSVPSHPLRHTIIDSKLITRLTGDNIQKASLLLQQLVTYELLVVNKAVPYRSWRLVVPTQEIDDNEEKGSRRQNTKKRILTVVQAISEAGPEGLSPQQIGKALNVSTPVSRTKWINATADAGYIATNAENPHDPTKTYYLTPNGRAFLQKQVP